MINIPFRKNGQRITASWFNRIRQYLSNLFLSGKRLKVNPTDNKPIDYYVSVGNEFLNHEPDSLIIVEDGVPGVHNTIHLPPIEDLDLQFAIKNLSDELLDIVTTETDIVNGDTIELLNDVKNKLVLRKNESVTVHADAYRPEWNVIGNVTDNFFKTEKDTDGVRNVSIDGTDNAYLKLNEPLDIQNCRLRFSDESQKLEYSTDKGVTWNKVEGSGGGGGSASTPFAINSGYAENGHNAIMSGVGTNTINFNTAVPIKVTTASGKNGDLVKVDPVTVSNDGTFNVFVDAVTGDVRLYSNKVYVQSETPTAENNFDVWLDTTIEPMTLKQWSGTAWVERDNFIWFGSVTVTGGNVAVLNNKQFNARDVTLPNGTRGAKIVKVFRIDLTSLSQGELYGQGQYLLTKIYSDGYIEYSGKLTFSRKFTDITVPIPVTRKTASATLSETHRGQAGTRARWNPWSDPLGVEGYYTIINLEQSQENPIGVNFWASGYGDPKMIAAILASSEV